MGFPSDIASMGVKSVDVRILFYLVKDWCTLSISPVSPSIDLT
jgi:hypothetical protein